MDGFERKKAHRDINKRRIWEEKGAVREDRHKLYTDSAELNLRFYYRRHAVL